MKYMQWCYMVDSLTYNVTKLISSKLGFSFSHGSN